MKFKFRADSKDILYFVIFCLFLLYLIAVGVLNVASLTQNNEFYGFNPFMAFTPKFIVTTVFFFFFALAGIIFTVSSHFFQREKGIGFLKGKSESGGYSRWSKKEEMKKLLKKVVVSNTVTEHAGVPLITDPKEVWVDDGEAHSLIVGTTGSGKTRRLVHPLIKLLAKKGESMILTDPKGELYEENAAMLIDKGYNIVLLNLRSPAKGNAWNPLTLPYKLYKNGSDKANELLNDLAINLLYDEKSSDDPFWTNTSADYFTALALGLFEDAKEEEINLNSISLMSTVGEERYGSSNYIKEYFSTKDPSKPTYINAASTINAPDATKDSILSVFRQKIKIFAITEHLSEMLSYSDFDMQDIGKRKTAVFIIIQDEKKTYHALATVFVKQCYETLIDVAHENEGKLPIRTNFILDEFANMPPLKDVTTMITAARSRQIRFNLIVQNFAQLNQVYGKENADTIKGNCANIIYLLSKELQSLEEISKLCGEKKETSKDGKETTKPLITISDLQRLKMGDAIIMKDRAHPFKTKYVDMSEYNFNEVSGIKPTYPERKKQPLTLFDLRGFVKEKKKDSLFGGFGGMFDNGNPSFPPPPIPPMGNMFGGNNDNSSNNNSFDVDDLIKKIDAKIAQLEEEEKLEQEKNNQVIEEPVTKDIPEIKEPKPPVYEDEPKEVININDDIENIVNNYPEDNVSDDAFFDDFFSDDDE